MSGWTVVACGCCGGIQWGGDTPIECRTCKGSGILCMTPSRTRLALYPGGPFAGTTDGNEVILRPVRAGGAEGDTDA